MAPSRKPRPRAKRGTFKRLMKELFSFFPRLLPITIGCIILSAAIGAIPALFMRRVYEIIGVAVEEGLGWSDVRSDVIRLVVTLGCLYLASLISSFTYNH